MHHLSDLVQQARFQGALFVSRANNTLIDAAYGWADQRTGRANTPETPFQIASVSKQLTAAAILLLQEQGAVSLHDPLKRWLTDYPTAWQSITVHHLLTHTSGIGHLGGLPSTEPLPPDGACGSLSDLPTGAAQVCSWHWLGLQ